MSPQQAIEFFGSQREIADRCEISPAAVSLWLTSGKIPRDRQFQLHVLSGYKLAVDPSERDATSESERAA